MQEFWPAVGVSLRVACAATALIILIGVPIAWWLARTRFWGKGLLQALLTVPLVMPPTVLGYFLVVVLGRRGFIGSWLKLAGVQLMFTESGAVIAAAVVAFPLLLLPTQAAFESVESDLEDVARLFGANTLEVFWHVSLPLARRGIASGALLAFARSLGEFGATVMVLGQIPGKMTLPISVYSDYVDGAMSHAWPAVATLVLASVVAIGLYNRVSRAES